MKKVFISYSHKDEAHKKDFESHLSLLKRNGLISIWHDRKINPGQDWAGAIDQNLESADIIIFLVSQDFLASDYCYEIEAKRALERQENGEAVVISIILRPCGWSDSNFRHLQALPKDALPIIKWPSEDEAWVDVINGVKKVLNETISKKSEVLIQKEMKADSFQLNDTFRFWLNDTEISLSHRHVDKVFLDDIYVSLDTELDEGKGDISTIRSTDLMVDEPGLYHILGEEQQGKTTFLKHAYTALLKKSVLPVYLKGESISKVDVQKVISIALKEQYASLDYDQFQRAQQKVILIDNFDKTSLNSRFKNQLLHELKASFNWIILTSHNSIEYASAEIFALSDFKERRLLEVGNVKREEFARKWISIGVHESIEDVELYPKVDELKKQLDLVIKKNLVPRKPIYILLLIQTESPLIL